MSILPASLLLKRRSSYQIDRSLRFNDDDTAYLTRTFGAPTSAILWTYSVWVKRGFVGSVRKTLLGNNNTGTNSFNFEFKNDTLMLGTWTSTSWAWQLITTQLFRDTSAWHHIVVAYDSAQVTSSDRVKIYVNGTQITAFSTASYPSSSFDPLLNVNAKSTAIGSAGTTTQPFDGYMAEIHFVDGTALTPTSFGEDDNGIWRPKRVSGLTYGTNGFYLSFADNSSTTTLGYDDAGSNDWTLNNFSVAAGVGNDSLEDTPTDNFCVFNKLNTATTGTLANGGLDCGASGVAVGSVGMSSLGWYWEITSTGGTTTCGMWNGSATSTTTVTTGTTKGFRFDADAGTFDWTSDGSSWTSIATGLTTIPYFVYVSTAAATTASLNAGQRAFSYTQPGGYRKISTANLPTPDIANPGAYMNAVTYTGTGSSLGVTGVGFQPDLVWIKGRSGATDHALYDAVRGVQKQIESNTTTDETTETTGLTAFGADGFTVGALAQVNTSLATYVAWCWKEGVTPGFDIVSYTGNGSNRTISHGLGTVPKMIIIKARTTASTDQGWPVYHASNTTAPETDYLLLSGTAATADLDTLWNDTAPTTTVFSVGTNALVNTNSDTYIAYLFAEIAGFSRFGSYTGNGSADGPFVWCNFRPRFVGVKRTDTTGDWFIWDTSRDSANVAVAELLANSSAAEAGTADIDILSNGFKLRATTAGFNASGGTYIFFAFAEAPFQDARAR